MAQAFRSLTASQSLLYFFSLAAVLLLGVINLNLPFLADQSVVLTGAKVLERGGVLYVDFWDNKMPGLFWFYWLGGKLFGFDEQGIHSFELLWMSAFSIAMAFFLRREYSCSWLSAVAPLAVVGIYYASAGPNQLTLPEFVVCFPLFLCAYFASRAGGQATSHARLFFFSGICAGVSVTFKLIFAPICVAFWMVAFVFLFFREKKSLVWILQQAFLPITGGVVLVLGAVVFKFWLDDALSELLWTAFIYPTAALESSPFAGKQRLLISVMSAGSKYAVWLIPIGVSLYYWWKSEKDIFTTMLIAWLLTGLLVILAQKFSWWGYHFFLIFPPLGLLGLKAIDIITDRVCISQSSSLNPMTVSVLLALMLCAPIVTIINEKAEVALVSLIFEENQPESYRAYIRRDYAVARASTVFLKQKGALPGDIIVFGDPLYYHLSDRYPAIPMIGWPWEYFLQSQWLAQPEQIIAASPPYIFIADREKKIMEARKGGVQELIYSRYVALHRSAEGTWFQLKKKFLPKE